MIKIIIVDDNVNVCLPLKTFLERMDHNVIMSHHGEDALEKVKNLKPDIMLLDITMNGMDGMEVLRRVRLFDKSICIIMISGLIDEATYEEALENGADKFINKPCNYKHLNEYILTNLIMRNKEKKEQIGAVVLTA